MAHTSSREWLEDSVVTKVKRVLSKRGNNGLRSVVTHFRSMDANDDAKLSPDEFSSGLLNFGVKLTPVELKHLTAAFDTNGDGLITLSEFIRGLFRYMPPRRRALLDAVWALFDLDERGNTMLEHVLSYYSTESHPLVKSGEISLEEAELTFQSFFNYHHNPDGVITMEEFFAFYAGVSQNIPDDDYFEDLICAVWCLTPSRNIQNVSFGAVQQKTGVIRGEPPQTLGSTASHHRAAETSQRLQACYARYGPNDRNYNTEHLQANKGAARYHKLVGDVPLFSQTNYESSYSKAHKSIDASTRSLVRPALFYADPAEPDFAASLKEDIACVGIDAVDEVRKMCVKKAGSIGFRGLARILRIMDENGNKSLDKYELQNGLQTFGLKLTASQMNEVMAVFDQDGSGQVSMTEFLGVLRGPMSQQRGELVAQAYSLLDYTGQESVTFRDMCSVYDANHHPDVLTKQKTNVQAKQDFLAGWDKNPEDPVTWEDFLDYYMDISAGIGSDDVFELMIRNCWHVSGGTGKSVNTSCKRMLVTHTNGKQTVQEIKNDLYIADNDMQSMMQNLAAQGITNVKKIQKA